MAKFFLAKFKALGFWLKKLFIPCDDNNYRPKILEGKYLVYILILACLLRLSTFLFIWGFPETGFFADISKIVLLDSLNKERSDLKLSVLKENSLLNKAALMKANDMMEKGYFSHNSPEGITPWYWFKKAGYNYASAGENLGIGFVDSKELHQAWNDSPSHKANLLSAKYKDVGIAFVEGYFNGSFTTIVVQMFGAPRIESVSAVSKPVVQNNTTAQKPSQSSISTSSIVSNQATANLTNIFSTTGSGVAGEASELLIVDATSGMIFVSTTTAWGTEQEQILKPGGFWTLVLKFLAKDYNSLTQKIVLVFLIVNIIALILNIVIKIFVQHYDLILKATLISLALVLLVSIGPKEIAALLQPQALIFQ